MYVPLPSLSLSPLCPFSTFLILNLFPIFLSTLLPNFGQKTLCLPPNKLTLILTPGLSNTRHSLNSSFVPLSHLIFLSHGSCVHQSLYGVCVMTIGRSISQKPYS
ncbi:hypothetical protein K402DRAFT_393951 [Aulographum hederae CBS 113979]|uniref:Uncharacterized protein n=1 Tax=Aulographum hederae CBS 113979 TaxID=1176131 RepID=A0A6G1GZ92_9PEZI|nr:hypothetical protein K402DRAFT_393951 [Aulographum hederae CBS 113979]